MQNKACTVKPDKTPTQSGGFLAFNNWLDRIGVTVVTGWRWRKKGWIQTINISGRVYISDAEIEKFTKRAEAGEFYAKHEAPYFKKEVAA